MANCKEINETVQRWQLRATVIIIGIITMILCMLFIAFFTTLLFNDIAGSYIGKPIWEVPANKKKFLANMDASIDAGMRGMCEFFLVEKHITTTKTTTKRGKKKHRRHVGDESLQNDGWFTKVYRRPNQRSKSKYDRPGESHQLNQAQVERRLSAHNQSGVSDQYYHLDKHPTSKTYGTPEAYEGANQHHHIDHPVANQREGYNLHNRTEKSRTSERFKILKLKNTSEMLEDIDVNQERNKEKVDVRLKRHPATKKWWMVTYKITNPPTSIKGSDLPFTASTLKAGAVSRTLPGHYQHVNLTAPSLVSAAELGDLCQDSVDNQTEIQKKLLQNDKFTIYDKIENSVHSVFLVLDIIMLFVSTVGLICGYLLIIGGFRKNRKYIIPWLFLSFTVAWGAVLYGISHHFLHYGIQEKDPTPIVVMILAVFIILGLHLWAFWAVSRYFNHLWVPHSKPGHPVRKMKLILTKRTD